MRFRWEGRPEKYARRFVHRNMWRIRMNHLGADDAMQECALVFARCANKYQYVVDDINSFMALYRHALLNHFITLGVRIRNERTHRVEDPTDWPGHVEDVRTVLIAGLSMSPELRQVLSIIAECQDETLRTMLPHGRKVMNLIWLKVLGTTAALDLVGELVALLMS